MAEMVLTTGIFIPRVGQFHYTYNKQARYMYGEENREKEASKCEQDIQFLLKFFLCVCRRERVAITVIIVSCSRNQDKKNKPWGQ